MPSYGFMTCVYTTEKISDSVGFPQFPSWLGKNSSERKNKRLVKELKNAIFPMTGCSSFRSVKSNYSAILMHELVQMMKTDKIEEAVDIMELYRLNPTILSEHLVSLGSLDSKNSPLLSIPGPTKAKLTRTFNKRHEEAKLKGKKGKKGPSNDHQKYDPVLE